VDANPLVLVEPDSFKGTFAAAEVAEAIGTGLVLLSGAELDPLVMTTHGTGDLLVAARDAGAPRIVLAAGGSATVDGDVGIVEVLRDNDYLAGLELTVLCDVRTRFEHAAEVFGPQKGARTPAMIAQLSKRLESLADTWPRDPRGIPMTGAGGGLSGGLWAVFNASLSAGASYILELVDFDERVAAAGALVVGEGQLDVQTLHGKIAGAIADRASLPVHAIVGRSRLSAEASRRLGLTSVQEASTRPQLVEAGRLLGQELQAGY